MAFELVLVALGGAIGGAARYWVSGVVAERAGETFPWGTLTVNVSGAFAIGVLAGMVLPAGLSAGTPVAGSLSWTVLAVGVLGSYTTVSSFSLQTLNLMRQGEMRRAALNVGISFALCPAAAAAGMAATWLLPVGS